MAAQPKWASFLLAILPISFCGPASARIAPVLNHDRFGNTDEQPPSMASDVNQRRDERFSSTVFLESLSMCSAAAEHANGDGTRAVHASSSYEQPPISENADEPFLTSCIGAETTTPTTWIESSPAASAPTAAPAPDQLDHVLSASLALGFLMATNLTLSTHSYSV